MAPDTRKPVRFLNYKARLKRSDLPEAMGPDLFGQLLYPVTIRWDGKKQRTRVGLSYIAPPTEEST